MSVERGVRPGCFERTPFLYDSRVVDIAGHMIHDEDEGPTLLMFRA